VCPELILESRRSRLGKAAPLPEPGNREEPFEDMIATVQKSAVLVLVYR
jgi:hypothetical protein